MYVKNRTITHVNKSSRSSLAHIWTLYFHRFRRWIMTLDPDRFELAKVQYFADQLTSRGQNMIMMVDPAVATGRIEDDVSNYSTLQNGYRDGVFYKDPENSNQTYEGVVWPGPTAFPDFTDERARQWWTVSRP